MTGDLTPVERSPTSTSERSRAASLYSHVPSDKSDANDAEAVDLRQVFGVLRRHVWLIAATVLIVSALTGYFVHSQVRQYRATAVLRLVDERRALAGNLDNSMPATGLGAGYWTDPIESEVEVLRSRAVAAAVVDSEFLGLRVQVQGFPALVLRDVTLNEDQSQSDTIHLSFGLEEVTATSHVESINAKYGSPLQLGGIRFTVAGSPGRSNGGIVYAIPRSAAVGILLRGLTARQREHTDVVDVSYTANDPRVAQNVVDAVVLEFQRQNADQAQQQSRRRRIFVEAQLKQTDSLLRIAQDRLSQYRAAKHVYGSADAVVGAEQTGLLNLDVQRQELAASAQVYRTLLDRTRQATDSTRSNALHALIASPDIAENPVIQSLYQQLVQYQVAIDSLSVGRWASAASNPDLQRVRTLASETQRRLVDAVQSQLTVIDARIVALDELHARNATKLGGLPATQAGEARLVEQVESTRSMAEQLRDEYQKARIAEAVEAGQVEIVDMAVPPNRPVGIGRKVKLLAALLFGLLVGLGAAFVAERLDSAINRREDIEKELHVPGLAIIPQIATGVASRHPQFSAISRQLRSGLPFARRKHARLDGHLGGLVTVTDFRSSSAEAYRTLRTNLIFSQVVQSLRTIVITSPAPQDGKTTTAANLAVTFAQQGMRVLLIDCDLRRSRLHRVFGTQREPGLTNLMLGEVRSDQVIQRTMVENLSFLPAGTQPPNPSELLGGPQMRTTLETVGRAVDILLLDTPPVHVAADATILGRQTDGVIFVLRAGHTDRDAAQDAVRRVAALGVRIIGAVLNDPDHKVPRYGSYHYYYDYSDEPSRA